MSNALAEGSFLIRAAPVDAQEDCRKCHAAGAVDVHSFPRPYSAAQLSKFVSSMVGAGP